MADDILLHVIWGRLRTTGVEEDEAMITMHFMTPDTSWPTTPPQNYEACEAALDAWWNTLKLRYTDKCILNQYRWYRKGSSETLWGGPGRVTNRAIAGSVAGAQVPPQCAQVCTEFTDYQEQENGRTVRHWGRFYLPAMAASAFMSDGTLGPSGVSDIADATEDLYIAMIAAGLRPCVHVTKFGDPPLPVHVPIKELRVDNVTDIQRRRRWDTVTIRETRTLPEYWGD